MRKHTYDFVLEKFNERGYTLLEQDYKNSNTKMKYECPNHVGLLNEIRFSDFNRGVGCRYCAIEYTSEVRKADFNTVKETFEKRGFKLIDTFFKNSETPLRYECPIHPEKETRITYTSLRAGHGCAYCAKTGKPTIEEVRDAFEKRGFNLVSEVYKNGRQKLKYTCPKHPKIINEVAYQNFKHLNQGCPVCAGGQKYTLEEARGMFLIAGYTLLEKSYVNKNKAMKFLCPKHPERDTRMSLGSIRDGRSCRYCYLDSNKGESHPRYDHTKSIEERIERRFIDGYTDWRNAVFERNKYTCFVCKDAKGGNLVAHHLDGYGWCVERRIDVTNGVTLCVICHKRFHAEYGYKNNTESQFNEWKSRISEVS